MKIDLELLANPADASWDYLQGQMRPAQGPLLETLAQESETAAADFSPALDLAYGTHPRETFDFFASAQPWRGTLAYFHAGYWQSRDKAQFRFLAPPFLAHGIDIALVNYPLCPDVTLHRLLDSTRAAIPAILARAKALGRGGAALTAAGHSAGGHIAVELALTDWHGAGLTHRPVSGILAISGIYELAPLIATALNGKLRLDAAEARALSPLHRVTKGLPPALFVTGALETPAFHAQSQAMHESWLDNGGISQLWDVADADHFSVLRAFAAGSALFDRAVALATESGAQT